MKQSNSQCILLICISLCVLQTCAFSALGKVGSKGKYLFSQFIQISSQLSVPNPIYSRMYRTDKEVTLKCDPCPKGIRCVPPIQCPAFVRMPVNERPQLCDLPAGTHGYCCTSGYNHTGKISSCT